ncbi:TolC family protein [Hydrocarboniphaga effusa]|uniref:TolC family protein n=1 Tax=Hydrocarboniphaga effusa TaxID=243629 RepID=UPI0035B27F6F
MFRASLRCGLSLWLLCAMPAARAESVESWVIASLASNLSLQAESASVESALAAIDLARSALRPNLALQARYSRTEGGRVIELPIGDLINPAYETLNELTAASGDPTTFPAVENQRFMLQREREQDTALSMSLPLWAPALRAQLRASTANAGAADSRREVLARTLVRDTRQACYSVLRAQVDIDNLSAAEISLAENLRATRLLLEAGRSTREPVLRAEAERLETEQRLIEARNTLRQAQRYLNFLVNRTLDSPVSVEISEADQLLAHSARFDSDPTAKAQRAELRQAEQSIVAADARLAGARAENWPTLSLDARYGVQDSSYDVGRDDDLATVSLTLSWTLFDGGARKARQAQAMLSGQQLRQQREQLRQQVELEQRRARDEASTQAQALRSAQARSAAADEALRIAGKRREAGSLTQLEYFDARRALTDAQSAEALARYRHLASLAELEFAATAYPLPSNLLADAAGSGLP